MIGGSTNIIGKGRLRKFIDAVLADGGTVEDNGLYYTWDRVKHYIRANSSAILLAGAYKAGKIYAMLPSGVTSNAAFSRSTVANRINAAGMVEQVAINVPINEYNIETGEVSYVLEPAATNVIPTSHSFAFLNVDNSSASAETPVVTGATVKAFTRNNSSDEMSWNVTGSPTGNCSFSLFVKPDVAGTGIVNIIADWSGGIVYRIAFNFATKTFSTTGSTGSNIDTHYRACANGWYRLVFRSQNGNNISKVGIGGSSATQAIGSTVHTHSWQWQTGWPTTYIKTTGSALTKTADVFSIGSQAITFGLFGTSGQGTIAAMGNAYTSLETPYSFTGAGNALCCVFGDRRVSRFDGTSPGASNVQALPNYRLSDRWAWRTQVGSRDSMVANNVITNATTNTTSNVNIRLLKNDFIGGPNRYVYMSFFKTYLSDDDIKALTV